MELPKFEFEEVYQLFCRSDHKRGIVNRITEEEEQYRKIILKSYLKQIDKCIEHFLSREEEVYNGQFDTLLCVYETFYKAIARWVWEQVENSLDSYYVKGKELYIGEYDYPHDPNSIIHDLKDTWEHICLLPITAIYQLCYRELFDVFAALTTAEKVHKKAKIIAEELHKKRYGKHKVPTEFVKLYIKLLKNMNNDKVKLIKRYLVNDDLELLEAEKRKAENKEEIFELTDTAKTINKKFTNWKNLNIGKGKSIEKLLFELEGN